MPTQHQLDFGSGLAAPRARSRRTDPQTSAEAAERIESTGKAATQRRICLLAVRAQPGLTAAEIASKLDCDRHMPSRRLPELRDAGLVRNGEPRVCSVVNSNCGTWFPIERGNA